MNLLIVEDEIEILNGLLAEMNRERLGLEEIFTATSLQEAKMKYENNIIELILCDIEIPDGSGLDFIKWVREKQRKTECMIMTCHEKFDYAKKAIDLNCREYIVKPVFQEELEEKLLGVIREINEEWEKDQYQQFGREWVKQISHEQEEMPSKEELVSQVKNYITIHLKDELRIERIAKKFYLSGDYLSRIFKKETGIGIGDYITEKRMFLAKELLKEGEMPVSRVAYECGYDNYSYFTKVFKKTYGVTPREYSQRKED